METRKFKQVPSINPIGSRNPKIPTPVIVSCGKKSNNYERIITRPLRTDHDLSNRDFCSGRIVMGRIEINL